ncbi:error-prone DNA polymerase [Sneathiella chinensis]|uniref:Error-prone DNA polymerase n=1 Tax=Sneathiella chinensis TaxID=349750 RepID=A0ABQ5U9D1_9PROT|nr:error-prone DNA polymerase [Sneathiella chinensis]GLQ07788.1 error-prone DNA polymerase [Sneathiella chinensis]
MRDYCELAITTNYSFLQGASHPHELMETAAHLGYKAIAIADRNTLAGIVRAHKAAKEHDIRLIVGARLVLMDGTECLCLPTDKAAYSRLTRLLTLGNRRAEKGACHLWAEDIPPHGEGQIFILMPPQNPDPHFQETAELLAGKMPRQCYLALSRTYASHDLARLDHLAHVATELNIPTVVTNDVLYHIPNRRPLQDILTCIRQHVPIHEAGLGLNANAERHLKSPVEMRRLFPGYADALARSVDISEKCRFSLDELAYQYPDEPSGDSPTPQAELERLTWIGAQNRYPEGIPDKVQAILEHELTLIRSLDYASYFLTVHDIVRHARSLEPPILCQGRGSAANSAVCYCLGITAVNPSEIDLLFERFISAERDEPPDIDVDFEHERREEIIQYIYNRYGRHRAGLAATVITYRTRSAIRDVGKAMGLSDDVVGALASTVWGRSSTGLEWEDATRMGLYPTDRTLQQTLRLSRELIGFPRHLSQHVGGFVITRDPLVDLVPIANAAMEDRTIVEWDKDDLDALGMLKIDILALGMLTCIRKAFDLLRDHYQTPMALADVPRDDPATYAMIQKADTIGVFQIESRAQMSMLPRLKPEKFYDLVIEVAIVRPGPIQGDMVHPYLRRRQGLEQVTYPSEELRAVLEKTKGIPLFQEQAMQIAIVGAGFTPAEADGLRRAMATFRHSGEITNFQTKFINGMLNNGYTPEFAERCFKQIEGFSDYGFPESHSASFALLAYVSAWLKCHYPDIFTAALLNSQPMGFYSASSIIRDFQAHGGIVLPVDINRSDRNYSLEPVAGSRYPYDIRMGLRQVKSLPAAMADQLVSCRKEGYDSVRDLYFRSGIDIKSLEALANADAFRSIGLDRRDALWAVRGLVGQDGRRGAVEELPLFSAFAEKKAALQREAEIHLPAMPLGQHVVEDYHSLRLSLKAHPLSFLRANLDSKRVTTAEKLPLAPAGKTTHVAGLVLVRQRPGSAAGVIFLTLEDETGTVNVIVWPKIFETFRRTVLTSRALMIEGELQKEDGVIHIIARQMEDLTPQLGAALDDNKENSPSPPPKPRHNLWRHPRDTSVLPAGRNFH